ncbi:MAG: sigma-70 family RNA polymerase sigma factor [Planctomycetes bacterium]|nr:sigma-70 family RNA polymerase sigma factor [Planctomycetota bacterium]
MNALDLPFDPGNGWRCADDPALLRRAAQHAPGAVEELVARHADRLCSFLVRIVRDSAWAEDLTQETLLRALQESTSYDARWPLRTWLFRIARNLALDHLRREGALRARDRDPRDATFAPAAVVTAEHQEFQAALELALQQLPEEFRTVFVLRDGEGLTYDEIAAVLGISAKTVSSRLHRARTQLRALLGRHA